MAKSEPELCILIPVPLAQAYEIAYHLVKIGISVSASDVIEIVKLIVMMDSDVGESFIPDKHV